MDALSRNIRYSLRSLARQPGFVVVAVLSLALGIGVNTAIFSALNALLWRPLPLRDLDRTVYVYHASAERADRGTSFPAYQHYRTRTDTFSKVMAYSGARHLSLAEGDRRDQVYAEIVTPEFFSMSDVNVRLGRPFDPDADSPSVVQFVAILSHAFWQRRFASDPGIVGKTLIVNTRPFTVIGVGAEGFTGLDAEVSADLWIPLTTWAHLMGEPGRLTGDEHWLTTMAQLAPGVTIVQAQAAMAGANHAVRLPPGEQVKVRPARHRSAGPTLDTLALAGGAFAIGLLILTLACTNVTNLLLARAAERQREMSLRMALGSGRARLIRLWLTESVLICAAAGLVGLVFAWWLLDVVVAFKQPTLIGQPEAPTLPIAFRLDLRSFVFALGVAMLTATIVGLAAGLQSSKPGARRFAPGFNLGSAVIALQMALSLILLIPCGLFVRSWLNASTMNPGFSTDHVLILPISTNQSGVRVEKPPGFDQALADRVAALPGVEAASLMDPVPLWFSGSTAFFSVEGIEPREGHRIEFSRVGPKYFETLRIRLLSGREFTTADAASAPPVAIINESMARRFWPDGTALGQRIRNRDAVIQIVGIARDAKYRTLADTSQLFLYRPLAQSESTNQTLSLAARTTGDPMRLSSAVEREVKALVPNWPAFQFRTLEEGLQLQQMLPRLGATFLGVLGAFGLVLAAVGMYGVMAYVVKQRTREIGIRLAIGAPIVSVITLLMKQGMAVCLVGAAIGLGTALLATRLLASLLYGISAADPLTFTAVPLFLLAIALLACYLPARHVSRLNAVEALRHE